MFYRMGAQNCEIHPFSQSCMQCWAMRPVITECMAMRPVITECMAMRPVITGRMAEFTGRMAQISGCMIDKIMKYFREIPKYPFLLHMLLFWAKIKKMYNVKCQFPITLSWPVLFVHTECIICVATFHTQKPRHGTLLINTTLISLFNSFYLGKLPLKIYKMNFTFNLELICVFLAILRGFVDQNERGFEGKRIQSGNKMGYR